MRVDKIKMFTDGTMWTWFKVLKWDMEAGKKSMQINDYKDKDRCQRWDKDGWLRSRSIPDELSYLRITDTISQCWRFPFPSTFSICKLPKKVHFSMFSPLIFTSIHGCSFFKVFVWPTKKHTITHDIWCISDEIWKVLKCTNWEILHKF